MFPGEVKLYVKVGEIALPSQKSYKVKFCAEISSSVAKKNFKFDDEFGQVFSIKEFGRMQNNGNIFI